MKSLKAAYNYMQENPTIKQAFHVYMSELNKAENSEKTSLEEDYADAYQFDEDYLLDRYPVLREKLTTLLALKDLCR